MTDCLSLLLHIQGLVEAATAICKKRMAVHTAWSHITAFVSFQHTNTARQGERAICVQDAEDESQMPKAWKLDAGEEPVNTQEPRL